MPDTSFDFTEIFGSERLAFLSTIEKETGTIQQNVVSWISGIQPHVIRVAVSAKSDIVKNIEHNPNVTFSFFYNKSIVSFRCMAKILTRKMPGVPMPLALLELETDELHDIMFYGAEISQEPQYSKTYNIAAAKKLDQQVYAAMSLNEEELIES